MVDLKSEVLVTLIVAIFASSGFWAFLLAIIQKKLEKKNASSRMLLGLGHDKIKYLAERYIAQGFVTSDDYEDLYKYLYKPYKEMGGNGTAEKLMDEVNKLPIKKTDGIQTTTANPWY